MFHPSVDNPSAPDTALRAPRVRCCRTVADRVASTVSGRLPRWTRAVVARSGSHEEGSASTEGKVRQLAYPEY